MAGIPNHIASKMPLVPRGSAVVVVLPGVVATVTVTGDEGELGPASVTDVGLNVWQVIPVGTAVPVIDTQLKFVTVIPLGPRNVALVVVPLAPAVTLTGVAVGGTVTVNVAECIGVVVTPSAAVTVTV